MKDKENAGKSKPGAVSTPSSKPASSRIPKIKPLARRHLQSASKSGGGGDKLLPDVSVHTGLPPQVEGSLRSYLILKVTKVTWFAPRPQNDGLTVVLVKWWGEDGQGSSFIPGENVKEGRK